jgi:signal transduction histidine kinase
MAPHLPIRTYLSPTVSGWVNDKRDLLQDRVNWDEGRFDVGDLTITSKKTTEGQLLISVSDSGIGIAPEQADRIFEAFYTTKPQGTGMALSISRKIIESHGGRLWANANSVEGTTV